jgi:(p)ppGpp synthase/HD superfamily hydrolase
MSMSDIKSTNITFEAAVRLLSQHMPLSDTSSRKPVLFHDIRVGVYLYERNYAQDIVLAGVLHDAIEWSDITKQMLLDEFGERVTKLVLASTKATRFKTKSKKILSSLLVAFPTGKTRSL